MKRVATIAAVAACVVLAACADGELPPRAADDPANPTAAEAPRVASSSTSPESAPMPSTTATSAAKESMPGMSMPSSGDSVR